MSPMYPNTPRSEFAFYCVWIFHVPQDKACLIEIIHFEGPDWLTTIIQTPYKNVTNMNTIELKRRYFIFGSKQAPASITIGNYSEIQIDLREEIIQPIRSVKEVFYANITAVPFEDPGKLIMKLDLIFIKKKFSIFVRFWYKLKAHFSPYPYEVASPKQTLLLKVSLKMGLVVSMLWTSNDKQQWSTGQHRVYLTNMKCT